MLANLNFYARVALCGSISQYNTAEPGPRLMGTFVGKRVTARGFIVWDFNSKYGPALRQMGEWVRSGRVKFREDIVEGIDKAPRAFIDTACGRQLRQAAGEAGPDPTARLRVSDPRLDTAAPVAAGNCSGFGAVTQRHIGGMVSDRRV